MAYPMMKWPTFAEFRQRLEAEFNCKYRELPVKLTINGGVPEPIRYFEREVEGEKRRFSIWYPDDERIAPHVIRAVCRRLGIEPAAFGLILG